MRKIVLVILLILGLVSFNCSSSKEEKLVVGLSLSSLKDPFLLTLKQSAEQSAEQNNIRLVVTESQANLAKQINAVEDLMQRGVDILVLNPVDAKGIIPAVEAANEAGIPVLTVDTDALGGEKISFIGSDNVKGGRLAGEYIIEKLGGRGNVAILDDVPGKAAIIDRIAGFKEALEQEPAMKIVSVQPAYGRRDMAITVTENLLQAHPEINAIFSTCDEMAMGVMDVLITSGIKNKIILVGFDASEEAQEAIRDNKLDADIAQFPDKMGILFIEAALKVANGEKVENYIPTPVILVTRENVDTFKTSN
ncbi:sugar ABC transporter substrate-binding protein [Candidatus Latescibacterota bacterium]